MLCHVMYIPDFQLYFLTASGSVVRNAVTFVATALNSSLSSTSIKFSQVGGEQCDCNHLLITMSSLILSVIGLLASSTRVSNGTSNALPISYHCEEQDFRNVRTSRISGGGATINRMLSEVRHIHADCHVSNVHAYSNRNTILLHHKSFIN